MAAARERLARALAPSTDQERATVEWIGQFDLPTLETLGTLVARVVAQGYDVGYSDGLESRARRGRPIGDADHLDVGEPDGGE
jgi:hypothetical protein